MYKFISVTNDKRILKKTYWIWNQKVCIQIPAELFMSYALFQPLFLSVYIGDDQ